MKQALVRFFGSFVFAFFLVFLVLASGTYAQEVPNTPVPPGVPAQPIPYSHKTHLALGLKCTDCHINPDPGVLMTFPATARCMQCHSAVATDRPSIQKLAEYDKSQTPVPWVRVYTLLVGVEWSHRKHVQAGMKCETCHGAVADMAVMAEVKSVRSMGGCIDCHKTNNAPTACTTCHVAWGPGMVVAKPGK